MSGHTVGWALAHRCPDPVWLAKNFFQRFIDAGLKPSLAYVPTLELPEEPR
jgi:hypothetical protein